MSKQNCIRLEADIEQINRCKEILQEAEPTLQYLSNALELAGNKVRLKILFLLHQEKQLCVCDLSDALSMSISAVSQHLRKLKDRDLVDSTKDAQTIYYSITKPYRKLLKPFFRILEKNTLLALS